MFARMETVHPAVTVIVAGFLCIGCAPSDDCDDDARDCVGTGGMGGAGGTGATGGMGASGGMGGSAGSGGSGGGTGTPIVVENHSFEEVACPADSACTQGAFGAFTIGVVPGWVSSGDSGVYNPQDLTFNPGDPGFPSDGLQSGYANTDSSLTQDGLEEIVDGVTYTLEIDVGRRFDEPNPTCCSVLDFEVSLVAGGEAVATGDQNDIAGGIPEPGDFGTLTLSFTGTPATAGQSLGIELASLADQTNWDDVRLESEPGSGSQGGDPGQ
jgi:hypothetical protein